ncbi:unnamed protein product, partial [Mesorhabditis belari]|uniref:Uncharacterized protein n=1 Tax=Mesorhabditis belari TaxID=2138241 RepID=A0AAF3FDT1_9BILA
MTTWCWHAVGNPLTPVVEEDYRSCCGRMKSKYGFIACLLIDFLFILLCVILITQNSPENRLGLIILIVLCLPITLIGFLALFTLKPLHMQLYWSLYILQMGFTVLVIGFLVMILFILPSSTFVEERKITKPRTFGGIFGVVLVFIATLAFVLWRGSVTYSYYKYIRDRQLAIEHHGSNLAHASDNLAHDIEK